MSNTSYADEGTCAHALAAMCLTENTDAAAYVGRLIECHDYEHAKLSASGAKKWIECPGSFALETQERGEFVDRSFSMEVTEEMAEHVQVYIDGVRSRVEEYKLAGAVSVEIFIEKQLGIGHITGEGVWRWMDNSGLWHECGKDDPHPEDATYVSATGTTDVLIIVVWQDGTALVEQIDLKFGMGVTVQAVENPQLMLYALGALEEYGLAYDIRTFRLTISQPRVRVEFTEWTIGLDVLEEFGELAKERAKLAHIAARHVGNWLGKDESYLTPGDHCRNSFCAARANCPALAKFVQRVIGDDFENVTTAEGIESLESDAKHLEPMTLGLKMDAVEIIADWCNAVRSEVDKRLLAGVPVPSPAGGYKLVMGKKGNRAWTDAEAADAALKALRYKKEQRYTMKVISPTQAEKLTKDKPKQWAKLKDLVTQSDGKPSVTLMSDPRPEWKPEPVVDDFDSNETSGEDLAG